MIRSRSECDLRVRCSNNGGVWRIELKQSIRHIQWMLLAVLLVLSLTSCSGSRMVSSSWPGIVVADNIAYVAFGPRFYAIDAERQRIEWQYPTTADSKTTYYAAPAVSDGVLVVGGYDSVLYGVDRETRDVVWNFNRASDRYIGSPVVMEGRVYAATAGNELFALNLEELNRLGVVEKADDVRRQAELAAVDWEFGAEHGIWSAPLVTPEMMYVTSLDHHVYALETDSGGLLWSKELPGAVAGSPVLSDDGKSLYVGDFDYNLYALSASSGEELWSVKASNWVWGTPVLTDERLFFADLDGYLYAVDPESGDIEWQEKVADAIRGGPVYDSETGHLYVAGRKESNPGGVGTRGIVLALDAESYNTVWEQPTAEAIYTSPVFSGDMLLVTPAQGTALLQVYSAETGVLQWEYVPPEN